MWLSTVAGFLLKQNHDIIRYLNNSTPPPQKPKMEMNDNKLDIQEAKPLGNSLSKICK